MKLSKYISALLILTLCIAAPAVANISVQLAADGGYLWRYMLDQQSNSASIDLLSNTYWMPVETPETQLKSFCAADGQLHCFYADGAYTITNADDGNSHLGLLWPQEFRNRLPLASCAGESDEPVSPVYLLLGAADTLPTATAAATDEAGDDGEDSDSAPKDAPATPAAATDATATDIATPLPEKAQLPGDSGQAAVEAATEAVSEDIQHAVADELLLLKKNARSWSKPLKIEADYSWADRVYIASTGKDTLAVIICTSEGWLKAAFCVKDMQSVSVNTSPAWLGSDYRISGLISTGDDLLLYGGGEALSSWIAHVKLTADGEDLDIEISTPLAVTLSNEPVDTSPESGASIAVRSASVATIIYPHNESWYSATLSLTNGQLIDAEDLGVSSENLSGGKSAESVRQMFFLVLMVIVGVLIFTRPQQASGPFVLPPGIRPANFVKRVIAAFVELSAANIITTRIWGLTVDQATQRFKRMGYNPDSITSDDMTLLVSIFCIYLAYCIITELIWSATPVKMLLGMKVCGRGGRKASPRSIILRNVMKPLELFTPLMVVFVCWPLISRWGQRAGDMFAGVAVINRPFINISTTTPGDAAESSLSEDEHIDKTSTKTDGQMADNTEEDSENDAQK